MDQPFHVLFLISAVNNGDSRAVTFASRCSDTALTPAPAGSPESPRSAAAKCPFLFAASPLTTARFCVTSREKSTTCPNCVCFQMRIFAPSCWTCVAQPASATVTVTASDQQTAGTAEIPVIPHAIWLFLSDYLSCMKICKRLSCGLVNNCLKKSLFKKFVS